MPTAEEILTEAREWIGSPYVHQGSLRGVGADCLGLIRGVWREVVGDEPEPMPAYAADWWVAPQNMLTAMFERHFTETDPSDRQASDILTFALRGGPVKHCAIITPDTMIHVRMNRSVREEPLTEVWQRLIVSAYRWPGVEV